MTVLYLGQHTLFKTAAPVQTSFSTVCPETKTCDCNANPVSLHFSYPREVKAKGLGTQQVSVLPKKPIKLQLSALSLLQEKLQCPTH